MALSLLGCAGAGSQVTEAEACQNVASVCRGFVTESRCLAITEQLGADEDLLLCLANGDSCDELLVCEGAALSVPTTDAGT